MSTVSPKPMTLLSVDFTDLYARHLCRHSQFGINALHIIALYGVWFGVYASIHWLTGAWWLLAAFGASYVFLVALNAPLRVTVATTIFVALMVASVVAVPVDVPWWALPIYLVMIPVCYQLQNLSHRVYTRATDMTEFNQRYPKGRVLFVVLLINEVPILLNYLLFDRQNWARSQYGETSVVIVRWAV